MKPEPAAAITAASAASGTLLMLARTGVDPEMPLPGFASLLSLLQDAARLLADALQTEAGLAGATLALPADAEDVSLRSTARYTSERLARAAKLADGAADELEAALRETHARAPAIKIAGYSIPGGGTLLLRARAAANRMSDLADALSTATGQKAATPLAMLTGHRQITEALTAASMYLARACGHVADPLTAAWGPARGQAGRPCGRAITALTRAADLLMQARRGTSAAQAEITAVWESQRRVPAVSR